MKDLMRRETAVAMEENSEAVTNGFSDELQINAYQQDDLQVLSVQGEVDLYTTPTLSNALQSWVSNLPPRTPTGSKDQEPAIIVLDLRQVDFIDSAGLALVVNVRKQCGNVCRLILLIARGSQPERVLKMGRFDTFLRLVYTFDELSSAPAGSAA